MGARYVWINVLVGGLFAVAVDAERRLIFEQQHLPDLGIDFSNISTPSDAAIQRYREGHQHRRKKHHARSVLDLAKRFGNRRRC